MKRVGRVGTVALAAVIAAGCGKQDVDASGDGAPGYVQSDPPAFPDGIFVAAYDGSDANDGSPLAPLRTVNAAIERAASLGKTDVYLYGGPLNGSYLEIVVLRPGIHLHGGLCKRETPPIEVDVDACESSIVGGSPSLVGVDIRTSTMVENLKVTGLPGVQSGGSSDGFFEVPGMGCIGRGDAGTRLAGCARPTDSEGRMAPLSSVAVALSRSDAVYFRNVRVVANDGAAGLDGDAGSKGDDGLRPATNGRNPGDRSYRAGTGAPSRAPTSCPDAIGGEGGHGGSFRWEVTTTTWDVLCGSPTSSVFACAAWLEDGLVQTGHPGKNSFLGALGVAITPSFTGTQAAADGPNGYAGRNGLEGDTGEAGGIGIDLVTLAAGEGLRGWRGGSGHGGSGGAGGNPATRSYYNKTTTGTSNSGIVLTFWGGSNAYDSSKETSYEVGEKAGAGGGAGGSGGCGGEGGTGGQGGAASVGIFLADSKLAVESATITTGRGGKGGRGGAGGFGGVGAEGSLGGAGIYEGASLVNGSFSNTSGASFFTVSASGQSSSTWTDGKSAVRSGKGGNGGRGGNGGLGGRGGAGAGGSSYAVVAKGLSAIDGLDEEHVFLGEPGDAGDADGWSGEALLLKTISN